MGLFGKKKEEKTAPACSCNGNTVEMEVDSMEQGCGCCSGCCENANTISSVKVLGSGCKSCHALYENVKLAMKNMNVPVEVEYVTDMEVVVGYGVMSMPALVLNEKVIAMGKVMKVDEVEKLFHKLGF